MKLMRRNRRRNVCRSWLALTAALATVLVASIAATSAAAAATPPQNTTRPTITGTAVVGKVLTAHPGSWSGTQPITFKYQWTRCSATGTGCTSITEAAQSQTYILTSDELGHRLRVIVTATNSAGTSSQNAPLTAVVKSPPANAPVNTTRPSISGSAVEGNTLTASNGSWNGATATYAYQWQRCDATGAGCHVISDATSQTYSATSLDVGNTLRVVVTATNSSGSGASISHQSAVIRSGSSVQVSLNASATVVVYGHSVTLSGTVAGSSGDTVTILARPGVARTLQTVGTTTTDANGSFSKTVTPRMRTVYMAKALGSQSDSAVVNVRPGMRLRHIVGGSLAVSVTAAKSFVGHYVTVQAFVHARWTTVKRVFLTRRSLGISPTVFSTASFRLSVRHGLKVRAFLTLSQSGPNYTSATSNTVRS
jgi:hypothetical protein